MKHRHNGKYLSHTSTGKVVAKHKPIHDLTIKVPKRIMDKDKGKSWNQLKRKYPHLNPIIDSDGDGKRNYEDCRPFDKKKQDLYASGANAMVESMEEEMEGKSEKEQRKIKKEYEQLFFGDEWNNQKVF